jgi:hypothetical protein
MIRHPGFTDSGFSTPPDSPANPVAPRPKTQEVPLAADIVGIHHSELVRKA